MQFQLNSDFPHIFLGQFTRRTINIYIYIYIVSIPQNGHRTIKKGGKWYAVWLNTAVPVAFDHVTVLIFPLTVCLTLRNIKNCLSDKTFRFFCLQVSRWSFCVLIKSFRRKLQVQPLHGMDVL